MTRTHTTVLHLIVQEAPDLSPASRDKYLRDLDAWVEFAGPRPVDWTRTRAQAFYNGLLGGMKPQSANRLMSSVSYASKWWAHREGQPELDFAHVQKSKAQGKEIRHALSPEQAIALLETTRRGTPADLRDRALIVIGLETGMRRMSLSGMKWEKLNAESAPLPYPSIPVPIKGHGKDHYTVPLSDACLVALAPWQEWCRARGVTRGAVFRQLRQVVGKDGHRTRTVKKDDSGLTGAAILRIAGDRARDAGIAHVHPHLFRHSFVTWRVELGASDHEIASITGHVVKSSGALGGYKDMQKIGAVARTQTPPWLTAWLAAT